MADSSVLILGGGVGGVVTANEVRRRLGREHRVVLVDRETAHVFSPSLLWVQVGLRDPGKISRDLSLLKKKNIEVVHGEVESIDPESKKVRVSGQNLEADFLVVSLGAQLVPEQIPGLAEAGYNLYSLDGASKMRDARKALSRGHLVVLVARTPFKCPAAPYEAAMLLDGDLRKRNLRGCVSMALYSPEPGPMGVAGPEVSARVRQLIEERGIAYFPSRQVTEVDPASKTLRFADGEQAGFDLLAYIPPHAAPPVVKSAGMTGESGWVPVDRHTLETRFPGVYAIGDITTIPLTIGSPLPKAGVFAHRQGEAVAQSIAAQVNGRDHPGAFDGHGECFVEVGGGKAAFGRGNFYGEPVPTIKLYKPGRNWHAAKVLFEKDWFRRWF